MSIIRNLLLEKKVREAEKTIAFANKLINPDPFNPFDHRMKANCQLRKKVGEQKAIELITEHGRCLIKKDKNTYRFLDGYVFDAEGNTTLNKNDKEQLLKNILEVVDNKNE